MVRLAPLMFEVVLFSTFSDVLHSFKTNIVLTYN